MEEQKQVEELRVRIYELVADGQWEDRGTGLLYVREEERKIVIIDETTQKEIMSHIVDSEIEYELQGTTIISWLEPETPYSEAMDLALSFQEADACAATWDWMGKLPCWVSGMHSNLQDLDGALPPLERKNLSLIRQHIASPQIIDWAKVDKDGFCSWFEKLHNMLIQCEDKCDLTGCEQIHGLVHELVKYSNPKAMEAFTCINAKILDQLLHIAEYHPHRKTKKIPEKSLRERYKKIAKLHLPGMKLSDQISAGARRLFTLIFLRDVALLSLFEDTSLAHFEHQIYHANIRIVLMLSEDRSFWINLRKKFNELCAEDNEESYDKLCICVSFCHELILQRCKSLKLAQRRDVILNFVRHGILTCLYETGLAPHTTPNKHPLLWRLMIETIHQTYSGMGITEMKNHVTEAEKAPKNEPTFLRKLLMSLHEPCEPGLQSQIIFLIRSILLFPDAQTPEAALFLTQAQSSNLSDVWQMFHEHHVDNIITLLERKPECTLNHSQLQKTQNYVIDILKSMVDNHAFIMKRTVLKNALLQKIAALITIPKNPKQPITNIQLNLSCMRFFRACIAKNESFYKKRIITHHILDSSVNLFCHGPRSNNLLSSCFLSIIHPMYSNESRSQYPELLKYVVDRYLPRLQKMEPHIFKELKKRYEHDLEQAKNAPDTGKETTEICDDDDKESEENLKFVPAELSKPTLSAPVVEKHVFEKIRESEFQEASSFDTKKKRRRSESPLDFSKLSKKQKICSIP